MNKKTLLGKAFAEKTKIKLISLFAILVLGLFIVGCSGPVGKRVIGPVPEEPQTPWCTDSDGGNNIHVKGTIYGYANNTGSYNYTDFCMSNITLNEYVCIGINGGGAVEPCPAVGISNGTNISILCSNGKCLY